MPVKNLKATLHKPVVIIGAGMAGLAAAVALSAKGHSVTVIEKEKAPGGKMRRVSAGGRPFDAGPTVMTMKWVFDELLAECGSDLASEIGITRSSLLARHYWGAEAQLDLHADPQQSAEAIADFSDRANAQGYLRFCSHSQRIFETLKRSYIAASRPGPVELSRRIGFSQPGKLFALKPFSTLWSALGSYFTDERLRQLFGRYATYCGSSPFQAPATLMLVAHVEQAGVWQVEGGMHALARKLSQIAERNGAQFRYGEAVERIETHGGSVSGVVTGRDLIAADRIIFNGDVSALGQLLDGTPATKPVKPGQRSLSALVSCFTARPVGRELAHHTVFFGDAYRDEFDAILGRRQPPADPTIYVCAQDRRDTGEVISGDASGRERIYMLMNMPAIGDVHSFSPDEKALLLERCLARLRLSGLEFEDAGGDVSITAPDDFERLFPGSGGALYGMASHGWMASFKRQGARARTGGLYLAGGSVHPGPGVPMAALSGRLAAEELLSDLALT